MFRFVFAAVLLGAVSAQAGFWKCQYFSKVDCNTWPKIPVCANDDVTYDNTCFMEKAACTKKTLLYVVLGLPCDKKALLDVCSAEYKAKFVICDVNSPPVCGSDGKNYANLCEFHNARCDEAAKFGVAVALRTYPRYVGNTCESAPQVHNACTDYWLKQDCTQQYTSQWTKLCDQKKNVYANSCFFNQAMCKDKTVYGGSCY